MRTEGDLLLFLQRMVSKQRSRDHAAASIETRSCGVHLDPCAGNSLGGIKVFHFNHSHSHQTLSITLNIEIIISFTPLLVSRIAMYG